MVYSSITFKIKNAIYIIFLSLYTFTNGVQAQELSDSFTFRNKFSGPVEIIAGQKVKIRRDNHPVMFGTFIKKDNDHIYIRKADDGIDIKIKILQIKSIRPTTNATSVFNDTLIIKHRRRDASYKIISGQRLRIQKLDETIINGYFKTHEGDKIILTDLYSDHDITLNIKNLKKLKAFGNPHQKSYSMIVQTIGIAAIAAGAFVTVWVFDPSYDGGSLDKENLKGGLAAVAAGIVLNPIGRSIYVKKFKLSRNWYILTEE